MELREEERGGRESWTLMWTPPSPTPGDISLLDISNAAAPVLGCGALVDTSRSPTLTNCGYTDIHRCLSHFSQARAGAHRGTPGHAGARRGTLLHAGARLL